MNNVIQTKSYAFAIRIVNAYKFLIDSKKEYVLTKQVLRSGTAIGAFGCRSALMHKAVLIL